MKMNPALWTLPILAFAIIYTGYFYPEHYLWWILGVLEGALLIYVGFMLDPRTNNALKEEYDDYINNNFICPFRRCGYSTTNIFDLFKHTKKKHNLRIGKNLRKVLF